VTRTLLCTLMLLEITRRTVLLDLPTLHFPRNFAIDLMQCVLINLVPTSSASSVRVRCHGPDLRGSSEGLGRIQRRWLTFSSIYGVAWEMLVRIVTLVFSTRTLGSIRHHFKFVLPVDRNSCDFQRHPSQSFHMFHVQIGTECHSG
jgi:hypothetical protein